MGHVKRRLGLSLVIIGVVGYIALFAAWWRRPTTSTSSVAAGNPTAPKNATLGTPQAFQSTRMGSIRVSQDRLRADFANLPLSFEPNRGQTTHQVKFLSRGSGYTLFLTSNEAALALKNSKSKVRSQGSKVEAAAVLHMKLLGANPAPRVSGLEDLPGKSNYFIGNDPKKWRTDIPNYARVKYRSVYPRVDLAYYGNQHQLEYDFEVAPGADPGLIRLRFEGADEIQIGADASLVLKVKGGEVRFHKPVAYQMQSSVAADHGLRTTDNPQSKIQNRKYLDSRYVLTGQNEVRFEVGPYDPTDQLIIDPVLSYSTYLGGSSRDSGFGIAVDSSGSAYVTGETSSTDFPTTVGAYQVNSAGASDVFVTKFDPTGTNVIYSTYIGGEFSDRGNAIAVDSSGNAYVTGRTNSDDFPLVNAWQQQLFGDFDAFMVKLNAQGDVLLYSTYLGGHGNDEGSGIAVDSSGNAYVTGGAGVDSRDDFPTTTGAFQRVFGGGLNDAFVTKFDPTQSGSASLVYSTFLGGGDVDRGNSIAVDSAGNAYVTGRTHSTDFPTWNPLQAENGGGAFDVFVTELNSAGTDVVYSTYLGGTGIDQGFGIAVDPSGNAYVTGETDSTDFPTTPNAYQTANAGDFDAFVAKIGSGGSPLVYSTYLGGSGADIASGIALDATGIAYITGRTSSSTDFPTSQDAIQPTFGGGFNDAFVAKIDPSLSGLASLVYSSYLGGSDDENIPASGAAGNPSGAIAVDGAGNAYVTGNTSSTDFPTVTSFQGTFGGGLSDTFVTQITFTATPPDFVEAAAPDSQTIAAGSSTTYTVTVSPTGGFTGDVTLSVDGLPPGASATFDPPVITITDSNLQSSTMTVMTDVATPLDTYSLAITGASDSLQHTASVSLVITSSSLADLSITKTGSLDPARAGTVPQLVNRRRERSNQRVP